MERSRPLSYLWRGTYHVPAGEEGLIVGVFIEPPFWATEYQRPVSQRIVSTVVIEPAIEPITVAQGKAFARDDTYDEGLMAIYIRAARSQVEQDTGLALLTQTRDVSLDYVSGSVIQLPAQSLPLQSVTSVKTTDSSAVVNTLATTEYIVDLGSGRLSLTDTSSWPSDLRGFQPWVIRIVSGWTAPQLIPPLLVHAVGLLTGHYANAGRDVALVGAGLAAIEMPHSYEAAIGPYKLVTVA